MTWDERRVWERIEHPIHEVGMDRNLWGDGPWVSEPDAIFWYDDSTRLPCLIWRSFLGSLNGYVGVDRGHPYFGQDYATIEYLDSLSSHGGLTFAGFFHAELAFRTHKQRGNPAYHLRVQKKWAKRWSVEALGHWWFGFDSAHAYDFVPGLQASLRIIGGNFPMLSGKLDIYRDVGYVRKRVEALAQSLAPVPGSPVSRKPMKAKRAAEAQRIRPLERRLQIRSLAAELRESS